MKTIKMKLITSIATITIPHKNPTSVNKIADWLQFKVEYFEDWIMLSPLSYNILIVDYESDADYKYIIESPNWYTNVIHIKIYDDEN